MFKLVFLCIFGSTVLLFAQELSVFDLDLEEESPVEFFGEAYLGFDVQSLMDGDTLALGPRGGLSAKLSYDSESVLFRSHFLFSDQLQHVSDFSVLHRALIQELFVTYQFVAAGVDLQFGYQKPIWNETNLIEVEDTIHTMHYALPFAQPLYKRLNPSLMLNLQYYIDTSSLFEAWYTPVYEMGLQAQEYWNQWNTSSNALQGLFANGVDLVSPHSSESGQMGIRYSYNGTKIATSVGYSYLYFTRPQLLNVEPNDAKLQLGYGRAHRFSTSSNTYLGRFQFFSQAAFFLSDLDALGTPFKSNHELRYDAGLQYEIPYGPIIIGADANGIIVFGDTASRKQSVAELSALGREAQEQYIASVLQPESIDFRLFVDVLLFGGALQWYTEAVLEYPGLHYLVQSRVNVLLHTTLQLSIVFGLYETAESPYFGLLDKQDYLSIALQFFF